MRLNNAYSKCDIPSLSAGYNRCNIGDTMKTYWEHRYNTKTRMYTLRYYYGSCSNAEIKWRKL